MPRIKDFSKGRTAAALLAEPEEDPALVIEPVEKESLQRDSGDENDASAAFQKQIDALRKSEQTQREHNEQVTRERDDAVRRANERDA